MADQSQSACPDRAIALNLLKDAVSPGEIAWSNAAKRGRFEGEPRSRKTFQPPWS